MLQGNGPRVCLYDRVLCTCNTDQCVSPADLMMPDYHRRALRPRRGYLDRDRVLYQIRRDHRDREIQRNLGQEVADRDDKHLCSADHFP